MNILFISTLYPDSDEPESWDVTPALHNFVKVWNLEDDVNVIVVRPVFVYLSELFGNRVNRVNYKKNCKKRIFKLDNVSIFRYPVFKVPRIAYFYFPLYRAIHSYLKTAGFKPDIVVAHYDKSLIIGSQYAGKRKIPYVAGLHITPDLMIENPGEFNKRCGKILEKATAIACRSRYISDKIRRWFPGFETKGFIASSGIDGNIIQPESFGPDKLKEWKSAGKKTTKENEKTKKTIRFVTVSSLIKRKKIDTILTALAALNETLRVHGIDWQYIVIGDGKERKPLENLTETLGFREHVVFKGQLNRVDVIEELKRAHFFILVSYLETFGLVYLEAMACGTIVIGSKGEGIDGILIDEKNGFLTPAGDADFLKNKLEKIILTYSFQQLKALLHLAHQTINQYTEQKTAENYLRKLKSSISSPNPPVSNNQLPEGLPGVQGEPPPGAPRVGPAGGKRTKQCVE